MSGSLVWYVLVELGKVSKSGAASAYQARMWLKGIVDCGRLRKFQESFVCLEDV